MMLEDISFNTSDPNIIIHIFNIAIKPNIFATIDYRFIKLVAVIVIQLESRVMNTNDGL